jgi:predicted small lipoprotein YifL
MSAGVVMTTSSSRPRSRRLRVTAAILAVGTLAACGETIDLSAPPATVPGEAPATTVVSALDAPLQIEAAPEALLAQMLQNWLGLDQRVIDRDRDREALERILALWTSAEPVLRAQRPELLFGFGQAVDLARSSVERNRPADASKGYRLARDLTDRFRTS